MKYLKITLFIVVCTPLLCLGIFHTNEYFIGNKYLPYLRSHITSFQLSDTVIFGSMDRDIQKKSLILMGEIHGFKEPQRVDFELYKYLHENFNVKTYLVEMDFIQAHFLNQYLENGDENLLSNVLKKWVVNAGRDNATYLSKWKKFREYYKKGNSFKFIGINNLSDPDLLSQYLFSKVQGELGVSPNIQENVKDRFDLLTIKSHLESLVQDTIHHRNADSLRSVYKFLLKNVEHKIDDSHREAILTQNLIDIYDLYNLKNEKIYGFFGLGHTLAAPLKGGYEPMAYRLGKKDPWFKKNLLVINSVFADSYMWMKSNSLPSILQDDSKYTRLSVSYDDLLLSYLYGISDLLRVTEPHSASLIKLNDEGSPYFTSKRLMSMTKLLPFGQTINAEINHYSADYGQYLMFYRNSDWANPFPENE